MKKTVAGWLSLMSALTAVQGTAFAEQYGEIDKLKEFVTRDQSLVNLQAMDSMGLTSAALDEEHRPWSDTFWPDVLGSIAYPYAGAPVNIPLYWSWNRAHAANRDGIHAKIANGTATQAEIDNLSPAEKYDLLMGDMNFTLDKNVVHMVDVRNDGDLGLVTSWSGVCHGWSPASLTLPRPKHSFQLTAPTGQLITFFPADVKGLASFLWGKSNAQGSTKVEGWQCQTGARTNRYGRLTDPRCFDVNPAFFHLTMVNQIGLNHHGFIMDRNFRTEVQNQPVWAYTYKYFKTTDRHATPGLSLNQAITPIREGWDPYRHFRSLNAVSVVGVEVTLTYGKENGPNHEPQDGIEHDRNLTYTTRYDLELNAAGDIVGGEWREFDDSSAPTLAEQISYQHPDIIWLVPPGVKAYSVADADITGTADWDGYGPMPTAWRIAGIRAANNTENEVIKGRNITMPVPQPLAKVVDKLIELSR